MPASTVPLVLTPGGSLEIQVWPQTLALPQPPARLLGADGRVYAWNVFTDDGKIRLAGPLRRFENVLADTLPVEKAGALILEPGQAVSRVAFRSGLDDGAVASLLARREGPGGSPAEARPEVSGFAAAAPVAGPAGVPWGWIFVGRKKSGQEFTDEDRDLLDTLAAEMAAALGPIFSREKFFIKGEIDRKSLIKPVQY